MYLDFIWCLILMLLFFQPIAFLMTLPFRVAIPLVSKTKNGMAILNTSNQILIAIIYSAIIAIISYGYPAVSSLDQSWPYATTGLLATFIALSSNGAGKWKQILHVQSLFPFSGELVADTKKIIGGATIGALIGLVVYIVFYFWPEFILQIPGSVIFMVGWINTCDKLMSYWIIKVLVVLYTLVYLIAIGFPSLKAGVMFIFSRFVSNRSKNSSKENDSDK